MDIVTLKWTFVFMVSLPVFVIYSLTVIEMISDLREDAKKGWKDALCQLLLVLLMSPLYGIAVGLVLASVPYGPLDYMLYSLF